MLLWHDELVVNQVYNYEEADKDEEQKMVQMPAMKDLIDLAGSKLGWGKSWWRKRSRSRRVQLLTAHICLLLAGFPLVYDLLLLDHQQFPPRNSTGGAPLAHLVLVTWLTSWSARSWIQPTLSGFETWRRTQHSRLKSLYLYLYIHKLLEIGENTWWTNFSLFDQGCMWRLRKARLHHTFKLKITPGFTLSDVSHMHGIGAGVKKWQMRASPVTSPYQYDRKFPNLLSCYLQPTSPLEVLLSNYPTCSSPILTLSLNWGRLLYKNPFVCDRGLTQPQLGPFLNSKLFLE